MTPEGVVGLLSAILGGTPKLEGAHCKGKSEIWDETSCPELIEYAVNHCLSCRAQQECARWLDGLPKSKQPIGIVAGRARVTKSVNTKIVNTKVEINASDIGARVVLACDGKSGACAEVPRIGTAAGATARRLGTTVVGVSTDTSDCGTSSDDRRQESADSAF